MPLETKGSSGVRRQRQNLKSRFRFSQLIPTTMEKRWGDLAHILACTSYRGSSKPASLELPFNWARGDQSSSTPRHGYPRTVDDVLDIGASFLVLHDWAVTGRTTNA